MVTTCFSKIRRATCTVYINWHLLTTFIFIPSLLVSNFYHVVYLRFPSPFEPITVIQLAYLNFFFFNLQSPIYFYKKWHVFDEYNSFENFSFYVEMRFLRAFFTATKNIFFNYRLIRKGSVELYISDSYIWNKLTVCNMNTFDQIFKKMNFIVLLNYAFKLMNKVLEKNIMKWAENIYE
jgi:hypothetical protein